MIRNAKLFLLGQLRYASRMNADELRFTSGQQPSLRVKGELCPAAGVVVRAAMVQAVHEACVIEDVVTYSRVRKPEDGPSRLAMH